jgi:hypothetical protein
MSVLPENPKPEILPPSVKEEMRKYCRELIVKTYGEHWTALQEMKSKADVEAANARIHQLQGPSPRDRAWPLNPIDPNPPHVPGWDAGNRLNLAVAKQVYDEYVAAGKIKSAPVSKA